MRSDVSSYSYTSSNLSTTSFFPCTGSLYDLSAEVTEVAPANCVVEISKSAGELRVYNEFCRSRSTLLKENSCVSLAIQKPQDTCIDHNPGEETVSSKEQDEKKSNDTLGYASS